jgi:hypothetical protein
VPFNPDVKDIVADELAVCVDISIRLSVGTEEGSAVTEVSDWFVANFKGIFKFLL